MKRNCNFNMNPAFAVGMTLLWIGIFARNVLELDGPLGHAAHFICGAACALVFIGLLYGSPKTRPLFGRLQAFKLRLLGRESAE